MRATATATRNAIVSATANEAKSKKRRHRRRRASETRIGTIARAESKAQNHTRGMSPSGALSRRRKCNRAHNQMCLQRDQNPLMARNPRAVSEQVAAVADVVVAAAVAEGTMQAPRKLLARRPPRRTYLPTRADHTTRAARQGAIASLAPSMPSSRPHHATASRA